MGEEQLGFKKVLTTKDLVAYGMCFMVPVAPFVYWGILVPPSQGMVALGYSIAFVAMFFTGLSYDTMSKRYPIGGSVYRYTQQSTHPALGFLAGWGMILAYLIFPGMCWLIIGMFLSELTPGVNIWIYIIIFGLITTVTCWFGIKFTSRLTWILFFIEITCVAVFVIMVFVRVAQGELHFNTTAFYNPNVDFNMNLVFNATIGCVLCFIGFDAVSTLADETKDPKRMIGKATLLSLTCIGLLFIFIAWLAGVVVPDTSVLDIQDYSFLDVLDILGGRWLYIFGALVMSIAYGVGCALECMTSVTRILYALGKDGMAPKFFGKLNKHNVPGNSILFMFVISFVIVAFMDLTIQVYISSIGALIGFMSINLAVVWRFFIKEPQKTAKVFFRNLVCPLIGFAVCFVVTFNASSFELIFAGVWICLGILWIAVVTKGFKNPVPTLEEL